jgi:transcriptional regulator NrdR family protein
VKCPACGHPNAGVINSRKPDGGTRAYRRRKCECGHRFTTIEIPEEQYQAAIRTMEAAAKMRAAITLLMGGDGDAGH